MKRPVHLLSYPKILTLVLLLAGIGLILLKATNFFTTASQEREGEGEEMESPAEALGPMDTWGGMRSYPSGDISAAAFAQAYDHMKMMPVWTNKTRAAQSRIQASNWVPLGPMNFAGRVLSLAFHPTNQNIMWAGSAGGGLWKTTNGGTGAVGGINWTQVNTGFPILSVPAIAVNPKNANEIYIGTGEVYNTGSNTGFPGQNVRTFRGSYGVGILKSTDGGATWSSSLSFTNSSIKGVQEILIDTATPSNVFAATSDGVYRSTNSGGAWTLIHPVVLAMDICFAPGNSNTLYVGCGDFGSAGNGIYKCTNALAATPTFSQLTSGLPASINGCIRMSICPDNANLIYASIGKIPGSSGGTAGTTYGLFKSTDAGATWAANGTQPLLGGSNYIQNQGWYAHDVIVAKSSVNSIYVSEIDMLRSTNGGSTFTKISDWSKWDFTNSSVGTTTEGTTSGYVHADHHRLYFSPFDNTYNTIFVVCDGGVFRSTDGGTTWTGLNGGLMTAQIYHQMAISATNSNLMLCGLQDNATLWYTGTTGCQRTTGGDGFYCVIDPTNDNICFGTYSYMSLYRSTTGPGGLTSINAYSNGVSATTSLPTENACFVAPVVMAQSNHNRMYGGTINFKRSTDNGVTWANYGTTNPVVNASAPIICIAVSKTFQDSLYIATCPGGGANPKILRSIDGGTNFTDITGTLPNRYFSSIAIDPKNSKRVAIAVSGFGTSHVFFTPDGGTTWNDIGGVGATALPDVPANVVMFDPTTPSTIYVGTDMGVFIAQNITTGATQPIWYSYNAGMTDITEVMDLLVAPNGKLRMGSYGKGLWENNMVVGSLPVVFENFKVDATANGNLAKWIVSAQMNLDHYEVEYSTNGSNFSTVGTVSAKAGTGSITYAFLHNIRNSTISYYRIKAVDLDGEITYSGIVQVNAESMATGLSVYPSPTTGAFKVRIPSVATNGFRLDVYDEAGKLVMQRAIQPGTMEVPVDISNAAAGNYQIICKDNKNRYVTRIVKWK